MISVIGSVNGNSRYQPITPITKKNVLKVIPCTEGRLHQVFIEPSAGKDEKKERKLKGRLFIIINSLLRKGKIEETKNDNANGMMYQKVG